MNINDRFERIGHGVRARRDRAVDALLRRMDLQPRQSALRPLLWLTAGVIVGGGLMLLLAPESSRKVREGVAKLARERFGKHKEPEQPAIPVTH